LTFARWSPGADVPAEYARQTKDWGIGYATTLKDHPAWVIADHPAIQLRVSLLSTRPSGMWK
jgi:hypothetical protein